ncbi:DUF2381 family protein [Pyxidicoccus sp. 3LG]
MTRAPSLPLLALWLLISASAAAQPAAARQEKGARLIELGTESARSPPELRISSSLSTVVLFDTPPSSVEVDAPQRFRRVRVAGDTLTLVPATAGLPTGARMMLTVNFQEGQATESAVLVLVVDETSAERQVEVHRRMRPPPRAPMKAEDLHEENQRLRQTMEAMREENQRLRQTMAPLLSSGARRDGLGELLANGPLKASDFAVRRIALSHTRIPAPEQPLRVRSAWTYRLGAQAVLLLDVENMSEERPWQVGDATLEDTAGTEAKALSVLTEVRLGPGEWGHIVLGAKALLKTTRGTFTLRLQNSEGVQTVTLSNIVFP